MWSPPKHISQCPVLVLDNISFVIFRPCQKRYLHPFYERRKILSYEWCLHNLLYIVGCHSFNVDSKNCLDDCHRYSKIAEYSVAMRVSATQLQNGICTFCQLIIVHRGPYSLVRFWVAGNTENQHFNKHTLFRVPPETCVHVKARCVWWPGSVWLPWTPDVFLNTWSGKRLLQY